MGGYIEDKIGLLRQWECNWWLWRMHDHQSQEMRQPMQQKNEQIRQQNERMQRILQHLHIQPIIPAPSLSPTIADGTDHHVNDTQVDRPYDMENDH